MHSFGARTMLLAPLHSLQLRVYRAVDFIGHCAGPLHPCRIVLFLQRFHNILRYLRASAYICGFKTIFLEVV